MLRTPQYDLIFYQLGDFYSAADDLERMTVIDNQLFALSRVVGDGVLTGWTIGIETGLTIEVTPGSGFIGNVLHRTLTLKETDVIDDAINSVYLTSRFLGDPGGFKVEIESPSSATVLDIFVNTDPPAVPTGFIGTPVDFSIINLFWDANSETDFKNYIIDRDTVVTFPTPITVGSPVTNGVSPNDPFQDTELDSDTSYFYRISAVDTSVNTSTFSIIGPITTLSDIREPGEPTNLKLLVGNEQISLSFDPSPTVDVTKYIITTEPLNPDGSPASSSETDNGLIETAQITGLTNGTIYRIRVQSVRAPDGTDIRSDGVVSEISPASLVGPSAVTGLSATPGVGTITLAWTASASGSGSATGQKSSYKIRVVAPREEDSAPIDVGLGLSRIVASYNEAAIVGTGPIRFFEDDTVYLFKITTSDSFGNESGPTIIKATTVDVTVPKNPRSLFPTAVDSAIKLAWKHSQSSDVINYEIEIDTGSGFGAPISVGYVEKHTITGLTNGTLVTFRVKSIDDAGNKSSGSTTISTPVPDTVPPEIPSFVRTSPGDEHIFLTWSAVPDEDFSHFIVVREAVEQDLDASPNAELTVIPGSTVSMNVGSSTSLTDIGLTNAQTYAYKIRSVDIVGNQSDPTGTILVRPSPGLNVGDDRLESPTNPLAVFSGSPNKITITWDYDFFGATLISGKYVYTVNPSGAPTAFNIYRSTDPLVGFKLVESIDASLRIFVDTFLLNGVTYYYRITAVRDTADLVVDTSSITPPNSLFLGTVEASSGAITSIKNEQRIADNLESTLTEETLSRLFTHRHTVKPLNNTTVTSLTELSLIDINDLSTINLNALPNLSETARQYFSTVDKDPNTGSDEIFDDNIIYIFSPNNIINNIPFIGDFQLLIDSLTPSDVEFTIDESNNSVVFAVSRTDDEQISVGGLNLTYYVPAILDPNPTGPEPEGFTVLVNDEISQEALVNEKLQTVRFLVPRGDNDIVTVELDATVPNFGTQDGARQISLSPQLVLSDFVQINSKTFKSDSGNFEAGDSVVVLTNGVSTTLDHFVDFSNKSIVFTDNIAVSTLVSLDIRNKEEVKDLLPSSRIIGLDASQSKSGKFTKPQLPDLSHTGRVQEQAFPIFAETTTVNNYTYEAPVGLTGSSTTIYGIHQMQDNAGIVNFLLGTSRGLLKSTKGIFLGKDDDADLSESLAGLGFTEANDIVLIARGAVATSGRTSGNLVIDPTFNTDGSSFPIRVLSDPTMVELDNGKVLIVGGTNTQGSNRGLASIFNSYLFDPISEEFTRIEYGIPGTVGVGRGAAMIRLPSSSKVLATGGERSFPDFNSFTIDAALLFDSITELWTVTGSMSNRRKNHAMHLTSPLTASSKVLVAGGVRIDDANINPVGIPVLDEDILTTPPVPFDSAELYDTGSGLWTDTGTMVQPSSEGEVSFDGGKVLVDDFEAKHVYDPISEIWELSAATLKKKSDQEIAGLDGPIKQFFEDSTGALLAVSRSSVFESNDNGVIFSKMKGLEAVGVVHLVSELSGRLFAATDLGIYVIDPDIRSGSKWFQGGLIGAGTTETFDLAPFDGEMLAATEIGVFASTDGVAWVKLISLDNVFNIETFGDTTIFVQSNKDLYRSDDAGANFLKVSTQLFFGPTSIMVARDPLSLFVGTPEGLFSSSDGIIFNLVDFDFNRDPRRNNVHEVSLVGSDIFVSYDNNLFSVGPGLEETLIAEFTGTIPTVRINGEEIRNGFRYDVDKSAVTFEIKRISDDEVSIASNYSLYQLSGGGWYAQNPSAPVQAFVDKDEHPSEQISVSPRLGQISFSEARKKFERITVSIAGTTLQDEGELFHDEVEDRMESEKGLPLSLGRNYSTNLLQLGLSVEHNLLERGLERDQYYCLAGNFVDRSLNSFWSNSEFFILGRRDYDVFNSTLDFRVESDQKDIGAQALVPLSSLEVTSSELYIGTDNNIFVLNPSSSFSVSETISLVDGKRISVRDLQFFGGDVLAATNDGIFTIEDDGTSLTISRNTGNNLPRNVFSIATLNNLLVVGTDDTIYHTNSNTDPSFETWFRSTFTEIDSTAEIVIQGTCRDMLVRDGRYFSIIGSSLFSSISGQQWERIFQFSSNSGIVINKIETIAEMLFLGTNKGVYNDRGTARSNQVSFELESLETTSDASTTIHINDMYAGVSSLYAATDTDILYERKNEVWTKTSLSVSAVHEVIETSGGIKVAISNNQVFTE